MPQIQVISLTDEPTQRTRALLFRPFHRKTYLAIALAAALTLLGDETSIDTLLHLIAVLYDQTLGNNRFTQYLPAWDDIMSWLPAHTGRFILYMSLFTLLAGAIYLLYRWLNSRGQFMLLDYASKDPIPLKQSWHAHKKLARSYLKLRIWWDLILFNIFLAIAILASLIALSDWKPLFAGNAYTFSIWSLLALIFASLASLAAGIFIWLYNSIIHTIVPAVMYQQNLLAKPALHFARKQIFRAHPKPVIGYFLMMLLANSAARLLILLAITLFSLLTCGTGFLLALIPLLGAPTLFPCAFLSLPVLLWQRTYMLEFTKQFSATP